MRLFFALWPDSDAVERLAEIARPLVVRIGGRAMRPETLHLTLAFLGEVPESELPRLTEAARRVRARSFDLQVDTLGYWRHNQLLWAGCGSPPDALEALAEDLHGALIDAEFEFNGGKRIFNPHVTLIRKLAEARPPFELPPIRPVRWHCREFVLVRSRLSETGSSYETVFTFPLDLDV